MSKTSYANILAEVKILLGNFNKSAIVIEEETELVNDLDLDSLLVMEMVQEVEDTFDITFPLNNLAEIRTVKDLTLQIQQEIKA